MFATLMKARRFAPLFWCQFFSAFNDNFVRTMLAMLILFRLGEAHAGSLITLAVGIFILPSLVLSGVGGELADSHDKSLVARRLKFAEIFVQMIAAAGYVMNSLPLLYLALFGLGVISALFGPIKYGILPDHLEKRELPAGNALVEAATFIAILFGIVAGGLAAAEHREPWSIAAQLMVIALACWIASRFIPRTGVAAPDLRVNRNIFASTRDLLVSLRADPKAWTGGIAVSWFWMTGAVSLSLVPVVIKERIGGGIDVETAVNALFAIGIALGSILAAIIAHGRIILLPTPIAALLMAGFLIDLGLATSGLAATGTQSLSTFFSSGTGIRIAIDVTGLATAGGLFVVPVFSAVQAWAGEERRARVIAGVNVLNSILIVGGALLTAVLQSAFIGIAEPHLLVALGALNIGAALYLFARLPANFLADFTGMIFRLFFRLEVKGLENLDAVDGPCVIAVNHVSFLDAPLMLSLIDGKPVFAIDTGIARRWWVRPLLRIARAYPMDPARPIGTRGLIEVVRTGRRLVIFPEGRITVTGSLMKVYDGAAMIADKADACIVPVRIEGLERTPFSRLDPKQAGREWFPKVRVTILPARKLVIDTDLRGKARRRAAGAALADVMSDLMFRTADTGRTLIEAVAQSAKRFGRSKIVLEDPVSGQLSARMMLAGAAILARKIMPMTQPGENVGVMLPNANGAAVVFFALQAAGRVPAMLNFTAGAGNLKAACEMAQVRIVLTSRAFVEKARLETIAGALGAHVRLVWLEDMREEIGAFDKLRGFLDAGRALHARKPDDPAAVLFTSGSEGAPKGVVLSHRNIMSNVAQVLARFDVSAQDIVFNVLPVFHSFGLTGGLILPLVSGMKVYLYPSPLHYRIVPELIYSSNATALFGTDTFLAGYGRNANPYDFRSLRLVVAGAEAVKAETRKLYMEKFGLRILEGYGVTETAPVLAVNSPLSHRNGTVGRIMPGMEHRFEPVPGIAEGGRLFVRGPNVMLGYYRADRPGVIEPLPDGWHDTGDIVTLDQQSFITIKGRAKRFAKIAGEMVSLARIEQLITDLWPDHPAAIVAAPDARKGERLVLVTTRKDARAADVQAHLKARGASDLMIPSAIMIFETLPLLGSGKTDHVSLDRLVRERLSHAAA